MVTKTSSHSTPAETSLVEAPKTLLACKRLFSSPLVEERLAAVRAVIEVSGGFSGRFSLLRDALDDPLFEVSCAALQALPVLAKALIYEKAELKEALRALYDLLAELEPPLPPFLPEACFRSHPSQGWTFEQREHTRQLLFEALVVFFVEDVPVLEEIGFARPTVLCFETTALLLARLGEKVLPILRYLLSSCHQSRREAAIFALSQNRELLDKLLAQTSPQATESIHDGLAQAVALGSFWEALRDSPFENQEPLIQRFVSFQHLAIFPLRSALRSSSSLFQTVAVRTIERLGALACETIPVLQWLFERADSELRCLILHAFGAMQSVASSVLPQLALCAKDPEPSVRLAATSAIQQITSSPPIAVERLGLLSTTLLVWQRQLLGQDEEEAFWALFDLAEAGNSAKYLLSAFLTYLTHPSTRICILAKRCLPLEAFDAEEIIPTLHAQLLHSEHKIHVVNVLGAMRGAAAVVIPDLIRFMEDKTEENDFLRCAAVDAFYSIDCPTKAALPALIACLQSGDEFVLRPSAARAVQIFGADAVEALPFLFDCLSQNDLLHEIANETVEGMGGAAVPFFCEQLTSENSYHVRLAISYLKKIGGAASAAVPLLLSFIKPEDSLLIEAANALEVICPRSEAFAAALVSCLRVKDRNARYGLGAYIENRLEIAIPSLVELLAVETNRLIRRSAFALLSGAYSCREALLVLIAHLAHPQPSIRHAAVLVFARIHEREQPELLALLPSLQAELSLAVSASAADLAESQDAQVRCKIVFVLGLLGKGLASAVSALLSCLADSEKEVRRCAASALGCLGEDAARTVPALVSLLEDSEMSVRYAAVSVIGVFGEDAASAVPALIACLDNEMMGISDAALYSLGLIGQKASSALPLLREKFLAERSVYKDFEMAIRQIRRKM